MTTTTTCITAYFWTDILMGPAVQYGYGRRDQTFHHWSPSEPSGSVPVLWLLGFVVLQSHITRWWHVVSTRRISGLTISDCEKHFAYAKGITSSALILFSWLAWEQTLCVWKQKHYAISLTLLLLIRRVRLTNGDEDDKEEERPEELNDELNLYGEEKMGHVTALYVK